MSLSLKWEKHTTKLSLKIFIGILSQLVVFIFVLKLFIPEWWNSWLFLDLQLEPWDARVFIGQIQVVSFPISQLLCYIPFPYFLLLKIYIRMHPFQVLYFLVKFHALVIKISIKNPSKLDKISVMVNLKVIFMNLLRIPMLHVTPVEWFL